MFYAPSKQDALGRFAEFFSPTQWEALKNNIESYAEFFSTLKDGRIHEVLRRTDDSDRPSIEAGSGLD
jgi:hypothetical protein